MNPVLILVLIAGALFGGMIVAQEIGRRIGRRRLALSGEPAPPGAGVIEAAVFALLGLLLAFQLSGAASRLELRRNLAVQEANAIGTAYLRLDFLPADRQPELRALFRRYVEARVATFDALPNFEQSNAADAIATTIQGEIWRRAVEAMHSAPNPQIAMLVTPALNEMIDITTSRRVATRTHAPIVVVALLVALALVAALLAGVAMSARPLRLTLHMVVFAAVTVATIYVIFEIEYPSVGMVRLGEAAQAIRDLRGTMQ